MKPLFFYDTETTGLPDWGKPSEHPDQPRITQVCAELVDGETREVLAGLNCIIRPDGWVIPPDLEKLTGITTAKAHEVGVPMTRVLPVFMSLWCRSGLRIAHNESFDMRMVRIEILRDMGGSPEDADTWKAGKAFCTCEKSKAIVNLPPSPKMAAKGMNTPKPPNLGEAYQHFTGTPLVNAHNAAVDVAACKAVYFGLMDLARQQAA